MRAGKSILVGLTAPITAFGVAMFKVVGDFEAGMNRVAVVSGTSANKLVKLRNLAKKMGTITQFSALQATRYGPDADPLRHTDHIVILTASSVELIA